MCSVYYKQYVIIVKSHDRTLREILKDADQMEQFYKFLVAQGGGCEVQLLFWLAVEDLKSCISNAKVYSRKMKRIIKKFFKSTETNRGATVM